VFRPAELRTARGQPHPWPCRQAGPAGRHIAIDAAGLKPGEIVLRTVAGVGCLRLQPRQRGRGAASQGVNGGRGAAHCYQHRPAARTNAARVVGAGKLLSNRNAPHNAGVLGVALDGRRSTGTSSTGSARRGGSSRPARSSPPRDRRRGPANDFGFIAKLMGNYHRGVCSMRRESLMSSRHVSNST
jgi:hypothetical protein